MPALIIYIIRKRYFYFWALFSAQQKSHDFEHYSHFSLVRTISDKEKILYYRELLVSETFFKTRWIPLVLPSPVILGEKNFLLSRNKDHTLSSKSFPPWNTSETQTACSHFPMHTQQGKLALSPLCAVRFDHPLTAHTAPPEHKHTPHLLFHESANQLAQKAQHFLAPYCGMSFLAISALFLLYIHFGKSLWFTWIPCNEASACRVSIIKQTNKQTITG